MRRRDKNVTQHADRPCRNVRRVWRLSRGADRDIRTSRHKRVPYATEHFGRQAKPCRHLQFVEITHVRPQRRQRKNLVDAQPELSFPTRMDASNLALQLLSGSQQTTTVLDEQSPRVGQLRTPAAAIKQGDAKISLRLLHQVSQCRRYAMKQHGRFRERACPVYGIEHFENFKRQLQSDYLLDTRLMIDTAACGAGWSRLPSRLKPRGMPDAPAHGAARAPLWQPPRRFATDSSDHARQRGWALGY